MFLSYSYHFFKKSIIDHFFSAKGTTVTLKDPNFDAVKMVDMLAFKFGDTLVLVVVLEA